MRDYDDYQDSIERSNRAADAMDDDAAYERHRQEDIDAEAFERRRGKTMQIATYISGTGLEVILEATEWNETSAIFTRTSAIIEVNFPPLKSVDLLNKQIKKIDDAIEEAKMENDQRLTDLRNRRRELEKALG